MKKIAIVSYDGMPLPPVKGGAIENLIQFLVEDNEAEKKAELTVFSVDDPIARKVAENYQNTQFVYIPKPGKIAAVTEFTNRVFQKLHFGAASQVYPYLIEVVKRINQENFDYVLVENSAEYVPYLKRKVSAEILLHVHNDHLCKTYYLADEVLRSCKKVFAVSDYVKNRILTIDPEAEHVSVLRNVIDVERFSGTSEEARDQLRRQYHIQPDDVVFAYFGRITPGKGVRELVQAFLQVSQKHDHAKLLVVGAKWFGTDKESPFTKELKALSGQVEDKIIFTGYVDYQRIAQQYACADVVVVPSIMGEACGLVVLEAMASGKALIVSDSGGIPENISPEYAIEVPRGEQFVQGLAEAMDALAADKNRVVAMGNRGREQAGQFDKMLYLGKLLQILDA